MIWQTTRHAIDLTRPRVMGIVNVTPDSFSDGDASLTAGRALARCEQLLRDGADLLDLGGESSRPGAEPVPVEVELARVLPVLRGALRLGCPVSVDSCKTEVMRAALDLGADIVNDIRALQGEGALELVVGHGSCGVCLMHMRGAPATMQGDADYGDVVAEVGAFLESRVAAVHAAGVAAGRIVVDPGIGFGKTAAHNLALLAHQRELLGSGRPLLTGWSRKSTLARLSGVAANASGSRSAEQTTTLDAASAAAAVLTVQAGASIVRVHNVAATVAALAQHRAMQGAGR
ncbi:MAG: dihydropteroate synthase [Pseudomonadota bacterium]|nr:dihydropteroate synthase [Pseudomonadota bacterium]